MPINKQEKFWAGDEGDAYLTRNFEQGNRYSERAPFYKLFESIPNKNISILEVGCSCAINLSILEDLGFKNFTGIDIGEAAIEEARKRMPTSNFIVGSILNLPFEDKQFDLVFSSGVLIHQDPNENLFTAMQEINRCSSQYVLGLEDHEDIITSTQYTARDDYCWRAPYSSFWEEPGVYSWLSVTKGVISIPGVSWHREYYKFEK